MRLAYDSQDGGDYSDEEISCGVKFLWGRVQEQVVLQMDSGYCEALCERWFMQHTVGVCIHILAMCS